jgi:starch phosphorylase
MTQRNPEGLEPLKTLALDLRCAWNHIADDLWRQLDPTLWEKTRNAWAVLQTVSRDRLTVVCADPGFRQQVDRLMAKRRDESQALNISSTQKRKASRISSRTPVTSQSGA